MLCSGNQQFESGNDPPLRTQIQVSKYRYLDGMPALLSRLKAAGYPMHAMSNYPSWYRMIEDKLQPSQYLSWTFVSCEGPMKVRVFRDWAWVHELERV